MINEGCMIFEPNTIKVEPSAERTYCPTCNHETTRVTQGVGPHYGECGSGHVYPMTDAKHKPDEPNEWPDQSLPDKAPKDGSFIIAAFEGKEAGTCVIEVVYWHKRDDGNSWDTAGGSSYGHDVMIGWWPCPIVRMPKG